jgi:AcrR family transcriptional regulator
MPPVKRDKRSAPALRASPKQDRAVQTRERLLDIAGELLGEVGIERISTNLICARAGVSPAALYRYFKDKYAILESLGPGGLESLEGNVEDLLRATAKVTASEPGGIWIERALRAVPQLVHVRVESHRQVTDALLDVYAPLLPKVKRKTLWRRLRMTVELGYAVDEMLSEEDRIPRDAIFREAALLLGSAPLDEDA